MNSTIVYAFGVGMVATFNPCGFAMLPAYLSYFLGLEEAEHADDVDTLRAVSRALKVGVAMTAGFVVVFLLLGVVLEPVLNRVIDRLPWLTIVLGIGLLAVGVIMLTGRTITARLPKLNKGTDSRELSSIFLFGISYALVSLSCTFPLFSATVVKSSTGESVLLGISSFIAYALGMGLVLVVLTLAIALARQSLVRRMRGVIPYVNRISGVLLLLAGSYVIYYGWYELRVYSGDSSGGGVARWVFDLSGRLTDWIERVDPIRVGLVLALVIALVVLVAIARSGSSSPDDSSPDRTVGKT